MLGAGSAQNGWFRFQFANFQATLLVEANDRAVAPSHRRKQFIKSASLRYIVQFGTFLLTISWWPSHYPFMELSKTHEQQHGMLTPLVSGGAMALSRRMVTVMLSDRHMASQDA
jgi:hypothetical protein